MIKNYLKVAWRNLVKNKAHTFINIAGLSYEGRLKNPSNHFRLLI
ncbi:MAG: MacB-like core protein [Mucilaginibacter sp.]|nr:MacB-like core protein [Mucilaginibacter sp.]